MEERSVEPIKKYDIRCSAELIMNAGSSSCIRLLEPFGPGNPQPIFQDPAVTIIDFELLVGFQHLQVTIRGKYSNFKGIGFSLGNRLNDVQKNA